MVAENGRRVTLGCSWSRKDLLYFCAHIIEARKKEGMHTDDGSIYFVNIGKF